MFKSAEVDSRRAEVASAMALMSSPLGLGLTASPEDGYLLSDAVRCYIAGGDVGAVFCVHASCERDLAALVQASDNVPARAKMWGLGALIDHLEKTKHLPADCPLARNQARKTLYHFGHSDSENALMRRTSRLIADYGESKLRADFADLRGLAGRQQGRLVVRYGPDSAADRRGRGHNWFPASVLDRRPHLRPVAR